MASQVLLFFIITFFVELIYYRIVLGYQWKNGIKRFNKNRDIIMKLSLKNYVLGSGHLYE
ncbi:hypothetical protein [Aestuariivivens insulae]|uniref:hypothetical protein n=1 Tax=Aestuariivivens insulae TaxID=1621988 RepID=UPI001F576D33|nr:hypothetical protein [Aestuariivivens insulae]